MAIEGLEFEEELVQLRKEIAAARAAGPQADTRREELTRQHEILAKQIFSKLTPWQITQLARHPLRPHTL